MSDTTALLLVCGSILAGTIIPGPSFIVVSRMALKSRRQGLLAAFGVAVASIAFAGLALGGFLVVLAQVPSLYLALKIAGGTYLCYLGWRFWRRASDATAEDGVATSQNMTAFQAVSLGALTQGSNPKAALVYASTFAAFLPPQTGTLTGLFVLVIVFCISAGWYGAVALTSSIEPVAKRYDRARSGVDRFAGALIGTMGLVIVFRSVTVRP
ncbi:LysE family translocator [Aestuariibius sp. 2305UL40-4]|uniref:LysE family translocator n=1 Tax=Aestuariibius violaceus TaxID=3234132 RepID=UPI00345E51D8